MLREPEFHPADEIRGMTSNHLRGVKIGFGLTGSVAIYRIIDVMRELIRRGADVYAVMSKAATELINPTLIEWAIGSKVLTEFKGEVGHVSLSKEVSSFTIAPATADIVSKLAHGICDNPVSLTAVNVLGLGKPVTLVPAMHSGLWYSPPVNEAMKKLSEFGVVVVPPDVSSGRAKLPENDDILAAIEAVTLRGRDLKDLKILVTAGPTREYLDRVRFLSNASSGKMGIAIAREAYFRGADVTLVHGPTSARIPHYVRSFSVTTTEDMLNVLLSEVRSREYDAVVLAAAPADFRFKKYFGGKIKSEEGSLTVELEPTPKISLSVRREFSGLLVGFAAEVVDGDMNKLAELALDKLEKRGFDIIIANDVSRGDVGFTVDYNEVVLISKRGYKELVGKSLKEVVARKILDLIKEELKNAR